MGVNKLKVFKKEALFKLDIQITKGELFSNENVALIMEKPDQSRDIVKISNFKVEFNQWVDITQSILYEIYQSEKFGGVFRYHFLKDHDYFYPSENADIERYIIYDLLPKIDYLKILRKNTKDFDEPEKKQSIPKIKTEKQKTKKTTEINGLDLSKIPIRQLFSVLTAPQIWGIIVSLAGVLVIAYYIGFFFGGLSTKIENADLRNEVKVLSKDVETLGTQNDSLKHITEDLKSGKKSDGDLLKK